MVNNKTGKTMEIDVDGIFIQIGETPNSQVAKEAGIKVDEAGFIIVDDRQRTNIAGVYAAGDVTICPVKQIGTAVGEAIIAANDAFGYIMVKEDFDSFERYEYITRTCLGEMTGQMFIEQALKFADSCPRPEKGQTQ